jgi:hypothetical protein
VAETLAISLVLAALFGALAAVAHLWARPWFARQAGAVWSLRGPQGLRMVWPGDRLWRVSFGAALAVTAIASGLAIATSRPSDFAAAAVFVPQFLVGTWMAGRAALRRQSATAGERHVDPRRRRLLLGIVGVWLVSWIAAGSLAFFPIESRTQAPLASVLVAAFIGLVAAQIVSLVIRVVTALVIGRRR